MPDGGDAAKSALVLTLAQWGDVRELAEARLAEMTNATPVAPGASATADLIAHIMHWQNYFAVDGDAAASELCPIFVGDDLPLEVVAAWTAGDGE